MTRTNTSSRIGIPSSLSAKITASFAVIAILFLGNVANNYFDSTQTQTRLVQITDESLPLFLNATEVSELIYSMEPALLAIMETESSAEYQQTLIRYQTISNQLKEQIALLNAVELSQSMANTVSGQRKAIDDSITELEAQITDTSATQNELIKTIKRFNDATRTLADVEETLTPLITDFAYELTDDYLISLIQELAASANYGMVIIEKLKSATLPESVEQLQRQLSNWLRDFDSYMGMLPATAGDDAELYRNFLKELSTMTDLIKVTAQGEFNNDTNDYDNGLQSIKQQQVSLILQQSENLRLFRQLMNQALARTDELVQLGFAELEKSTSESRTVLASQIQIGLISGFIALVLVLFISTYITRFFRRSINDLKVDLNQLAHGEIAIKQRKRRHDEFGAINEYVEKVALGLKEIVEGIGQANDKINSGVERVAGHASKTRDFAEGQKHELDMVATALTEMSATASEVANHASDTHDRVDTAGKLSAQGRDNMRTTKDNINQVSDQAKVTHDVIQSLASGVQNIESILTTIGGIAEQTNLLALNAAIEAARAGEQGRGFAVVADEVRALASRTQSSTLEIKDMTEKMLKDSNQAVEAMTKSSDLVNQSVVSAQVADDTIAQFDQLMEEVLDLSRLIATASEEQASTVNELNTNVHRVSALAEQTSEAAESSQQTGTELDTMAVELREKISRFHLSN